jgi:fructose-bisphosphate aldolase, class II
MLRPILNGKTTIALHGTNGFEPNLVRKCIAAGVSKINVNRLVLDDYFDHFKANAPTMTTTSLMEEGVAKVVQQTVEWMHICGSAGKA